MYRESSFFKVDENQITPSQANIHSLDTQSWFADG